MRPLVLLLLILLLPASARAAADTFVKHWGEDGYDFGIINFANPDMVGHTGSIPAAIEAIEADLPHPQVDISALLPYDRGDLLSRVHENGEVLSVAYAGPGQHRAQVGAQLASSAGHQPAGVGGAHAPHARIWRLRAAAVAGSELAHSWPPIDSPSAHRQRPAAGRPAVSG